MAHALSRSTWYRSEGAVWSSVSLALSSAAAITPPTIPPINRMQTTTTGMNHLRFHIGISPPFYAVPLLGMSLFFQYCIDLFSLIGTSHLTSFPVYNCWGL